MLDELFQQLPVSSGGQFVASPPQGRRHLPRKQDKMFVRGRFENEIVQARFRESRRRGSARLDQFNHRDIRMRTAHREKGIIPEMTGQKDEIETF